VINASWGGGGQDPTIADAIRYAQQHNVVIVAAAGNNGSNDDANFFAPASYSSTYSNLIAVAAIGSSGALASWSNYGIGSVALAAPGAGIFGLSSSGSYTTYSGTSMAAPLVAGTIALVEAAHPTWSMSQVIDAVIDHTTPDPALTGKVTTGGIVNAGAAVANTVGPYVVSGNPDGSVNGAPGISSVQLTFNEEINPATFTPSQVTLTGPGGTKSGVTVTAVSGSNNHKFLISFPTQNAAGAYTLTVGTGIEDWYGNALNQNRNQTNGESSDVFVETIRQTAPGSSDLLAISGIPSGAVAGTTQTVVVNVLSPNGGADLSYTGTIQFSSTDPQAGLPANYTFTAGDQGGHAFTVTFKTAGAQAITATDLANPAIIGTEENIIINPAAATSLKVSGFPTPDTSGAAHTFSVSAMDPFGNVATGYTGTVHFTSSDSQAILPANYTITPEQQGAFNFTATLKTAGTQSITATDTVTGSIAGTQSNIIVQPAALSALTVTGFPTQVTAGSAKNVTVSAVDAYGNAISGYTGTVQFTSNDPLAVLPASYTFTAADNGKHTFSATLKSAGARNLTVTDSVTSSLTGTESGIVVQSAALSKLLITGFPNPATTGVSDNFTVISADQYGNTVTGYTGTVQFTSSDSQAVLPASYTFVAGDAGAHTFSATLNTAGTQSITATDSITSTISGKTTVNVIIATGTATFLKQDTATQGNWIGVYGTQGYNIINSGSSIPAYTTVTPSGQSNATWSTTTTTTNALQDAPGHVQGNGRIAACWYANQSFTVDVNTTDGQKHNIALYFLDYDHSNTRIDQIQLTSGVNGAVLDTRTVSSFTNGVYLSWTISGHVLFKITCTGPVNAVMSGIFFDPPTSTSDVLSISGPSSYTAGAAQGFTVTAKSPSGGTDTQYTGIVHFSSSDVQAGLPANYTFTAADAGVHTFSATLKTAGAQSITATDTVNQSVTGTQSGITVSPAAASSLTVAGFPASDTAGTAAYVSVTAYDPYGNVATAYTGKVSLSSSDSRAALPSSYTFTSGDAGVHSFSVTLKTAGTQSITATDTANVSGSETGIVVTPAAANTLTVAGFPNPASAGVSSNFTVTAFDPYGNVATGYTGTVQFTSSDSQAVLPGNYTFVPGDAGAHNFSATLKSTGTQSITATDSVTKTITGSISVTVNAAGTTATFLKEDTTTQGNWIGVYGTQGYNVINNASGLPAYATVTPSGQMSTTWSSTTTTTNALQDAPGHVQGNGRIAACWYANASFTVDVNTTDGQFHNIELYLLDYDHNNTRIDKIQVTSAVTGTVLDARTVSSFTNGVYMNWTISGHVLFTITRGGVANGVLSGIFFDPPTTTSSNSLSEAGRSMSGSEIALQPAVAAAQGSTAIATVDAADVSHPTGPPALRSNRHASSGFVGAMNSSNSSSAASYVDLVFDDGLPSFTITSNKKGTRAIKVIDPTERL
jgi:hypothetical protein